MAQRAHPYARRETCNNDACQRTRDRCNGFRAAWAMAQREADASRTRVRFLERRLMGRAAMQPGDRVVEVNHNDRDRRDLDIHCLSERLKMMNAMLEAKVDHDENKKRVPVLKNIVEEYENRMNTLGEDEMHFVVEFHERLVTVQEQLAQAKRACAEYTCAICTDDLEPGKIMLGKKCYHAFCAPCMVEAAITTFKPSGLTRDDYNDYYVVTGVEQDPFGGERYTHDKKEEVKAQLEDGTIEFPPNVTVPCPMCREDYTDKPYYDACKAVQANPRPSPQSSAPSDAETAESKVRELRGEGLALLLEPPGDPTKVMLIPSKVPGVACDDERMRHHAFLTLCRAAGFRYGPVGNDNGFANFRDKRAGEEVDDMPLGANLRKTAQRMRMQRTDDTTDAEGRRHITEERVLSGGGNYRVDLPPPPPANNN